MKILIVNPIIRYMEGGAEINDRSLAVALESMGHEVGLIGVRDDSRPSEVEVGRTFVPVTMPYDYDVSSNMRGVRGKFSRNAFFHRFVKQLVDQHRDTLDACDVILCTGKPVLASVRDHLSNAKLAVSVRGRSRSWHHRWYRHADLVIYWGGCEADHPRRVLDQVPHVCVSPAVDQVHARSLNRSTTPDRCRLVFVGRLEPVKQVDLIIQAIDLLRQQGIPAELTVIGDGSMRQQLESLRDSLGLQTAVVFEGRMDKTDVASILGRSDIMVMASRTENKPIAAMESVMVGTHVIAPRLGRLPEILKDPDHGTIYEPTDARSLAEAVANAWTGRHYERSWTSSLPPWPTWRDAAEDIMSALHPGAPGS